jgi:hypothetical protein
MEDIKWPKSVMGLTNDLLSERVNSSKAQENLVLEIIPERTNNRGCLENKKEQKIK